MSTFGERLKELRKEYRLTQQELADNFYLNKSSISRYEKNQQLPENDLLQKIADYFNVSTDYLLGRSDIKNIDIESTNNWDPVLNEKDEKDIEKQLNKILNGLESDNGLMLNGEVLDDITRELLHQSIKNGLEYAKLASKKKFTPKKYRKNKND